MANKFTIEEINRRLDHLHHRLTATVRSIDKLRALRRNIRNGKVKQPAPKGVKVMFKDRPRLLGEVQEMIDFVE